MSQPNPVDSVTTAARVAFAVSGIITVVVGLLILVWPGRTSLLASAAFAIYAVAVGITGVSVGIFFRGIGLWRRGGHALIGLLLVIAGIVALSNLSSARDSIGTILGVVVGIVWIVQGIFAVAESDRTTSALWSIVFGVVSVLAGIAVLLAPLWGVAVLWLLLGVSLVVLGIAQLVRGLRIGTWVSDPA